MQLELSFGPLLPQRTEAPFLSLAVGQRRVLLRLVRNRRARRYVLRLGSNGVARITIPRGGSAAEAKRFAQRNVAWLEKQLLRQAVAAGAPRAWQLGTQILFRGETVQLEAFVNGASGCIRLGTEQLCVRDPAADLRPEVEEHLRRLASRELPVRVAELAALHQLPVKRVSVRNQRSRWGSCSRRGTLCLNWRLVQAPEFVRDYIILHELAHTKEMNHSRRFWKEVARICPDFQRAEDWLKQNSRLLR